MKGFKNSIFAITIFFSIGSREVAFSQWTSLNTGTIEYLYNVDFPSADTGYIVQESGLIRKTVNAGLNWTVVNSSDIILDFAFTGNETGYGIFISTIYETFDGGQSWDTLFDEPGILFSRIIVDNEIIYAFGENATYDSSLIVISYNDGTTWNRHAFQEGGFGALLGADFISASTGYVSDFGTVFKTTDSCKTWVNLGSSQGIENVYFLTPDTGFGMSTLLFRTTDGGLSWNAVNTNGNNTAFYDMLFLNDSVGYVNGGNGINSGPILKTTDGGVNWDLDTSSVQTFMAFCKSSNSIYACGTGGALWKLDLVSGLNENNHQPNTVQLFHDFEQGRFIVFGTHAGGNVTVSDMSGKLLIRKSSGESRTYIPFKELPSGNFLIEYTNKSTQKSFKGIRP